jgi:hypothetical protein
MQNGHISERPSRTLAMHDMSFLLPYISFFNLLAETVRSRSFV